MYMLMPTADTSNCWHDIAI